MTLRVSTRWWDWASALLLLLAMLFASARLAVTDWVPHLTYAITVALLGTLLGMALGASRFSRWSIAVLVAGYTLVILPWQLSFTGEGTADWLERLTSLAGRYAVSFGLLFRGRQVDDYIIFLTFVCLLFWGLGIFSGFALARNQNVLAALLPGGLAIVIVSLYDYYAASRMGYLAVFIFLGLALFGRLNFLRSRQDWASRRVYVNPDATTDLSVSIMISAALVVVLAWGLPVTVSEYKQAAQFWTDTTKPLKGIREKLRDAFAPVTQPIPPTGRDYYDQKLSLGLGSSHSDAVMFTVKVPPEATVLPRLYWRGVAYDTYKDGSWLSTAEGRADFKPQDQYLPLAEVHTLLAARYTFTTNIGNQRLLYTPADTVWVSRASQIQYFPADSTDLDIETIRTQQGLRRGEVYYARAPVLNPTVADLREAGQGYPDWVKQSYLQLPDGFSPRISQLAADITRDSRTPYDKAAAITDYLRREITWKERIPAPPANADPIEWFLFDSKQGFCNYSATAEVLMLRSIGIPARLVAGFSQGEPSPAGLVLTVREKNAHAWPEVYFPNFGWIEFEPTGNQDPLVRPLGSRSDAINPQLPAPTPLPRRLTEPDTGELPQGRVTPVRSSGLGLLVVWSVILIGAVVLFLLLRPRIPRRPMLARRASIGLRNFLDSRNLPIPGWLNDLVHWLEVSPIEQAFHAINQALRWLGKPPAVHATPAERAAALSALLPEAREEISILLTEQHAALFSRHPGDALSATRAGRRVRYRAIRKRLSMFIP